MGRAEELFNSIELVEEFQARELALRTEQFDNFFPANPANPMPNVFRTLDADGQIKASPFFGAWLDGLARMQAMCRTMLLANGGEVSEETVDQIKALQQRKCYLGNYLVAAALGKVTAIQVAVLSEKDQFGANQVMIPERGRATLGTKDDQFVVARIAHGKLDLMSHPSEDSLSIPITALDAPCDNWEPVPRIGPSHFRVALNYLDPNRLHGLFRYEPSGHLTETDRQKWETVFTDMLDFLQCDPYMAQTVRASLTTIVPRPQKPYPFREAMAAEAAFGVLAMSEPPETSEASDPERLASQIVFGIWKHLLMARRSLVADFHQPEDDPLFTKPVYAPSHEGQSHAHHLIEDGLLDAGFVRFLGNVVTNVSPKLQPYAQLSLARWRVELGQNLTALKRSGYIGPMNHEMVEVLEEAMAKTASPYKSIPERTKQIIATARLDHRLSWSLHNVFPDQQAMRDLCDIWRSGADCPPAVIPGELSESIAIYTHIGQRTRYALFEECAKNPQFLQKLAAGTYNPKLFGNPTAGDIAFVQNHILEARAHYAAAIQQQPNDREAWAGFALTFKNEKSPAAKVLTSHPEVAMALYCANGDTKIEPQAIAAWLAPARMARLFQDTRLG